MALVGNIVTPSVISVFKLYMYIWACSLSSLPPPSLLHTCTYIHIQRERYTLNYFNNITYWKNYPVPTETLLISTKNHFSIYMKVCFQTFYVIPLSYLSMCARLLQWLCCCNFRGKCNQVTLAHVFVLPHVSFDYCISISTWIFDLVCHFDGRLQGI